MSAPAREPDHNETGAPGGVHRRLDLADLLETIDQQWAGWECTDGGTVPAPWGFLVGVESSGGRLRHRPLPTHPALALAGWVAPGRWCAVGVAVRGTAHRPTDGPSTAADARVIWVCHRDGRSASLLGLAGARGTVVVSDPAGDGGHTGPDPDGEGRVPRLLREALAPPRPDVCSHPTDPSGRA